MKPHLATKFALIRERRHIEADLDDCYDQDGRCLDPLRAVLIRADIVRAQAELDELGGDEVST
jgi:hypothetical protein